MVCLSRLGWKRIYPPLAFQHYHRLNGLSLPFGMEAPTVNTRCVRVSASKRLAAPVWDGNLPLGSSLMAYSV